MDVRDWGNAFYQIGLLQLTVVNTTIENCSIAKVKRRMISTFFFLTHIHTLRVITIICALQISIGRLNGFKRECQSSLRLALKSSVSSLEDCRKESASPQCSICPSNNIILISTTIYVDR